MGCTVQSARQDTTSPHSCNRSHSIALNQSGECKYYHTEPDAYIPYVPEQSPEPPLRPIPKRVADDFGYVCLDKGKRELVNVVEDSKHNAETSHAQRPKQ